ncbi:MAG: FMN-binding negative transcriptional regulator [Chryseobacterium sp.]|jgi:transcriptional regulator|uniref:FMN-binding negative transcriptional regulator n=1 Tax=Chryseobacterium sp. TaxID=1871047 RepID=UPI0026263A96|nr:FMN-binding negative transcriptional regulator [Chryseobacterium sp.]MDF2552891.1 FMN-binding negative transcriptional regulator [Chryseobacterium sp.]
MFVPKLYRSEDHNLMKKIIRENAFALLISSKDKIRATHSMMMLNENDLEQIYIETHISKANPQAKILNDGDEVLCDFLGAHTYISSSWYDHLERLTAKYEKAQKCLVLVENMGKDFVEKEIKGAFGIKIFPTEIFIQQKLSQSRKEADFQHIISNLENSEDENSRKIANQMKSIKN